MGASVSGIQPDCESYGVDFQNSGTHFQNASSTEDFTFVQYFEGCQQDYASNILIDPSGNEYLCSDTPLTPSDTNELSTCPIEKCELYSGPWSIIITSNNGNGTPIAFQRDFSLIVGLPSTSTFTPTVLVTSISTPIITSTLTAGTTATVTSTQTTTCPSVTLSPTITITPARVIKTITSTTSTITLTAVLVEPSVTIVTYTKTCSIAPSQTSPDPTASVSPTLLSRRSGLNYRNLADIRYDREAWLAQRRDRLAEEERIQRRGLDRSIVTITDTNTADFVTSTVVVPAETTISISTTSELTMLSTEITTTTVLSGTTTLSQITFTAPTPTKTKTKKVVGFATVTTTQVAIVTITTSTAPAASSGACTEAGGKMV